MEYTCGCEANGENVANYCPIHNTPLSKEDEITSDARAAADYFSVGGSDY